MTHFLHTFVRMPYRHHQNNTHTNLHIYSGTQIGHAINSKSDNQPPPPLPFPSTNIFILELYLLWKIESTIVCVCIALHDCHHK